MGTPQSLVESYKAALSQWPIGDFYAQEHDHDDVTTLERMADVVLESDPENLNAAYVKASILMIYDQRYGPEKEQYEQARKLLKPILESGINHQTLVSDYAHCLYYTGQYSEAVDYLRKLSEFYPDDTSGIMMLCYALFKSGQKAEALQHFQPLIDQFPDLMPDFEKEITEMVRAGHHVISKLTAKPDN